MKRNSNQGSDSQIKNTPASLRRLKWKKRAVELYVEGRSQREVRDALSEETNHSFSAVTIHKYIKEAVVEWRETKNDMIASHKEIELTKINKLEVEYWEAWERSKRPYESTSETKTKGDGKAMQVNQVKTDKRAMNGDPRFLEGIHRCVEMRNKLLGIEVPQIQITQNNTGSSTTIIRRVVFKTRESTTEQVISEDLEE